MRIYNNVEWVYANCSWNAEIVHKPTRKWLLSYVAAKLSKTHAKYASRIITIFNINLNKSLFFLYLCNGMTVVGVPIVDMW